MTVLPCASPSTCLAGTPVKMLLAHLVLCAELLTRTWAETGLLRTASGRPLSLSNMHQPTLPRRHRCGFQRESRAEQQRLLSINILCLCQTGVHHSPCRRTTKGGSKFTVLRIKMLDLKPWSAAYRPDSWSEALNYSLGSSRWLAVQRICGHPLSAITDNWTRGATSIHITAPTRHNRPS